MQQQEQARQTQLSKQLTLLEQSVSCLMDAAKGIFDRLGPVLRPEPPRPPTQTNELKKQVEQSVPLVLELSKIQTAIDNVRDRLCDCCDRLEI